MFVKNVKNKRFNSKEKFSHIYCQPYEYLLLAAKRSFYFIISLNLLLYYTARDKTV